MATIAQKFYLHTTDWDVTDPSGGDIRKLPDVDPVVPADTTTIASHTGTNSVSIICDPYTTRTTTGLADLDKFGWAVNQLGSDGMVSTATAKRKTVAGVWTFQCQIGVALATLSTYTFTAAVYRVSSAGARAQLFTVTSSPAISPTTNALGGSAVTLTSASQPSYLLEADETILVAYYITKVAGLAGDAVSFRTGNTPTSATWVQVPSPGVRTLYIRSVAGAVALGGDVTRQYRPKAKAAALTLAGARDLNLTLHRTRTAALTLTAAKDTLLQLHRNPIAAIALTASARRNIKPARKAAALTLTGVRQPHRITLARASMRAALTLTASARRNLFKRFTATLNLGGVFTRFLRLQRRLSAGLAMGGRAFFTIPQNVLARMVSGGTTIIKKVFPVFD